MHFDRDIFDGLPVLITPDNRDCSAAGLIDWLQQQKDSLTTELSEVGAFLFRGFEVVADQFEAIAEAGTSDLCMYTGGGSPRTHLGGKIYTSTEYPANQSIPMHCEATYFQDPPHFIWFYCQHAAESQGETPIGDMSKVLQRIDPEIVDQFREKGVCYIYNLHDGDGFGRGWRQAFGTDEKGAVALWLDKTQAEYSWQKDGSLSVCLQASGLRKHRHTGLLVWGNQAANWHIASHGSNMARAMRRLYRSDYLMPKHAVFGDRSPIPDQHIQHVLDSLVSEEQIFSWQQGDVLLCDNQFIAHGRRPFRGDRSILVAMA